MHFAHRSAHLALLLLVGSLAACGGDSKPAAETPTAELAAGAVSDEVADAADAAMAAASAWPTDALIDPNTASEAVLAAIPGMSADAVQTLIAARPLTTPSELDAVIGDALSEEQLQAIYKVLFIKVDLNNGDLADYELIPSSLAPSKLAHEFEEYRPYETMDDFTREMSKYVSDAEVAYLTRFVTIE